MAQRVTIELVDDLDGSDAAETVLFGLDGQTFEIDLSTPNAAELRTSLAHYAAVARTVNGKRKSPARKAASPKPTVRTEVGPTNREIRDWARTNGIEVPDRGRVPASVRDAFDAAH